MLLLYNTKSYKALLITHNLSPPPPSPLPPELAGYFFSSYQCYSSCCAGSWASLAPRLGFVSLWFVLAYGTHPGAGHFLFHGPGREGSIELTLDCYFLFTPEITQVVLFTIP